MCVLNFVYCLSIDVTLACTPVTRLCLAASYKFGTKGDLCPSSLRITSKLACQVAAVKLNVGLGKLKTTATRDQKYAPGGCYKETVTYTSGRQAVRVEFNPYMDGKKYRKATPICKGA